MRGPTEVTRELGCGGRLSWLNAVFSRVINFSSGCGALSALAFINSGCMVCPNIYIVTSTSCDTWLKTG